MSAACTSTDGLERIETIYKPYHAALRTLLTRTHARFGHAVLVDCHSMPSTRDGASRRIRPDFVLGDRYGTSCAAQITWAAAQFLSELGYTVEHQQALCRRLHHRALRPAAQRPACAADRGQSRALHERGFTGQGRQLRHGCRRHLQIHRTAGGRPRCRTCRNIQPRGRIKKDRTVCGLESGRKRPRRACDTLISHCTIYTALHKKQGLRRNNSRARKYSP